MRALEIVLAVTASFLFAPASADAHHGFTAFDRTAEVTLHATVTEFHFTSPHAVVEFEAIEDGQVQKWQVELGSRSHLALRGWTATTIEPGNKLTVIGYRAKGGARSIWATKILRADGSELKV